MRDFNYHKLAERTWDNEILLYKFLNDKFMAHLAKFAEEIGMTVEEVLLNENDELNAFYDENAGDVSFEYEDTIQYLINHVESLL